MAAARNAGLAVANGDYIALLDADDLWLPEKLAMQVEIARRTPESGMIACDGQEFGSASSRPYLLSGAAAAALRSSRSGELTRHFHREFIRHVNIRCPAQTLIPAASSINLGHSVISKRRTTTTIFGSAPDSLSRFTHIRWCAGVTVRTACPAPAPRAILRGAGRSYSFCDPTSAVANRNTAPLSSDN